MVGDRGKLPGGVFCPQCSGTGFVLEEYCSNCAGEGVMMDELIARAVQQQERAEEEQRKKLMAQASNSFNYEARCRAEARVKELETAMGQFLPACKDHIEKLGAEVKDLKEAGENIPWRHTTTEWASDKTCADMVASGLDKLDGTAVGGRNDAP